MTDVAAIGELLADFAAKGVTPEGSPVFEANPGGAPLNFLAAAARYGCSAAMIATVGDDAMGRLLTKTLDSCGIDGSAVKTTGAAFTTMAFVTFGEGGEREFSFARKPGADTLIKKEELPSELIKSARWFHFGTLSMTDEPAKSATEEAVLMAKAAGAKLSFDPNYRAALWQGEDEARERMLWGAAHADVVKMSREELELLFPGGYRESARRLTERFGVELVFATDGAAGGFFCTPACEGDYPALAVENTVDTTGAGDIFYGAALSQIIKQGKEPGALSEGEVRSIARFAGAAAALSTQKYGGVTSIPEEEKVLALMEK